MALGLLPSRRNLKASRRFDAWAIALFIVAAIVWSAIAGKDLNWDQLNYHFYVAHSLLEGRLQQDFMAANGQSYLNPLAYVPFYLMVRQEWPSILIASVLACIHALNVVCAYLITRTVVQDSSQWTGTIALLGGILAFLSPMFLMTLGTTFADVSTSVFVLGALFTTLRFAAYQPRLLDPRLVAGLCFGIAGGLKLSNLVFAPAFALLLAALHPSPKAMLRVCAYFAIGTFIGLIASHGYWSWQLWAAFGNPAEPTLGSLLGSPDIPPGPTLPQRFLPESLLEACLLPFKMALLQAWIYVEVPAPDLRFAAVIIFLILAVALGVVRRHRHADPITNSGSMRRQYALLIFFVSSLMLWIGTSANGRYGLMVSVLCGPALVVAAQIIWNRPGIVVAALTVLLILQGFHLQHAQLRWTNERWTASWYQPSIPEKLARNPYLYISIGGNSNSYLAPYLATGSAFTNPIGQVSVDLDGLGGARLRELLTRHEGRIRVMAPASSEQSQAAFEKWAQAAGAAIARLDLAIDYHDCQTITTAGPHWRSGDTFSANRPEEISRNYVRVCATTRQPYEHTLERARVSRAMRAIAEWCPRLFQPSNSVVEQSPFGWYVNYVSTDTTVEIKGSLITLTQPRSSADLSLGTLEDWTNGKPPISCASLPTYVRKTYTYD